MHLNFTELHHTLKLDSEAAVKLRVAVSDLSSRFEMCSPQQAHPSNCHQAPPRPGTSAHGLDLDLLGEEVFCAGAVGPQSFLGKDGCPRSVSPAGRRGQVRRETLLGGRSTVPDRKKEI